MLHVLISLLDVTKKVNIVLAFLQMFRFDAVSSIKLLQSEIPLIHSMWYDLTP